MQHDGDRWRRHVARPFAVIRRAPFSGLIHAAKSGLNRPAAPAEHAAYFVPAPNAWPHEPEAGTPVSPKLFTRRHYLLKSRPLQAKTLDLSITKLLIGI